jgi:WhiB family redox-sensing transcriptional regulator
VAYILTVTSAPGRTSAAELLDLIATRPAWHGGAACKKVPAVSWFPDHGESAAEAKAICAGCPVLEECRVWALAQGPKLQGIWAGLSRLERAQTRDHAERLSGLFEGP